MANATGSGQMAASAIRQLKNSIDTAMTVVERIAPYRGATKWDWLCSSTAQSFMMEEVRSARSFFPKERQRDLPQLFRKVHTAHTGLHIGDKIGVVIFQPGADHNEQRRRNAANHIKWNSLCRQRTVHDLAHQQVQKPHRQHEGDMFCSAQLKMPLMLSTAPLREGTRSVFVNI